MVDSPIERRFEISRKANELIQSLPEKLRLRIREAIDCLIKGDVHHLDIRGQLRYF